ncbi:UL16-binding protein 6-like isoform X1 [Pipistrellus kuhlii]|uniref:UL16-binding protein 6-like isoform X1 n=1 Tax=Pipistrellus kuhlii TaxID=59472 RepID=UPI001E270935|nr:UL16-binding protein 6-like isoform X1 [Pipistrellus kuhlii]
MERSARLSPVCLLLLLLLWEPAAPGCARFLTFKFTVTPNGEPRCEIQGQVNGNTFFHYTCGSNKVTLISVPEMSATQAWNQQREALQYMVEEITKIMLDRKAEIAATGSPLSLQGNMTCKVESNNHTSASLEFGSDGQVYLFLDSKNGTWTVLHDEDKLVTKILASDREMTHLLIKTSAGDCTNWLKQVLCLQDGILSTQAPPLRNQSSSLSVWDKEKGETPHHTPTPGSVTMADTAASPNATATATVPSKANMLIILISSVIVSCLIIIGILRRGLYRLLMRRCQGGPGGVNELSNSASPRLPLDDLLLIFRTRVQSFRPETRV